MKKDNILQALNNDGFCKYNLKNCDDFVVNLTEIEVLKSNFSDMPLDRYSNGNRLRCYIQIKYEEGKISYGKFEPYKQTKKYNPITGDLVRDYKNISDNILNLNIFNYIINKDIDIVKEIKYMPEIEKLMIGVHLFRYKAGLIPAYSSPPWLHKDDEDIVFMHLVSVSDEIIGGESILAKNSKKIERVFKMKEIFETLVVNHNCFHAVTPMTIPEEYGGDKFLYRDIILVTFQKRLEEIY